MPTGATRAVVARRDLRGSHHMIICPFCVHPNEEGTRFCIQCKTDLLAQPVMPMPPASGASAFGRIRAFVPAEGEPELEVPTLQLNRVPLVESLGRSQPHSEKETPPPPASTDAAPVIVPEASPTFTKAQLIVVRGQKVDAHYPLYPGKNYLGRTDEKPVDIALEEQEPADRIWSSRQHAVISIENGTMTIEDLNSLNGTFVNRTRVHPGQVRTLQPDDTIIVGTIHLRLAIG